MNIWLMLLVQVILIALNAIFACAEIAVISVNDTKLDYLVEQGNRSAKKLKKLTAQPARFLATIQVAITLSGFLGSAFAAENFSGLLVSWIVDDLGFAAISRSVMNSISVILITLILSYLTLIFGELVPKRVAQRRSEALALKMAPAIAAIAKFFYPIVSLLTASTNGVLRLLRIDPDAEEESVSEEEIRMLADAGSKNGSIDEEENELIQNVFEFNDLTAGEIATHRTDMVVLWQEDSDADWEKTISESRFTRFPICGESVDQVIGVLNAKLYFRLKDRCRENVMREAVTSAYLVPETVKADLLFKNMKVNHTSFAIVLDEHGGVEGVITVNDLVECLVGDLTDTEVTDKLEQPAVEQLEPGVWRVRGDIAIDDLVKEIGVVIPEGDYDTFNGFVFSLLDSIPEDGSSFEAEVENLKIHVTEVKDHCIESAILSRKRSSAEDLETNEQKETAVL